MRILKWKLKNLSFHLISWFCPKKLISCFFTKKTYFRRILLLLRVFSGFSPFSSLAKTKTSQLTKLQGRRSRCRLRKKATEANFLFNFNFGLRREYCTTCRIVTVAAHGVYLTTQTVWNLRADGKDVVSRDSVPNGGGRTSGPVWTYVWPLQALLSRMDQML